MVTIYNSPVYSILGHQIPTVSAFQVYNLEDVQQAIFLSQRKPYRGHTPPPMADRNHFNLPNGHAHLTNGDAHLPNGDPPLSNRASPEPDRRNPGSLPDYTIWPYSFLNPPVIETPRADDKNTPEYIVRAQSIINSLEAAYREIHLRYQSKKQQWLRCKEHTEEMEWNIIYCKPFAGGDFVRDIIPLYRAPTQAMRTHQENMQHQARTYRSEVEELQMQLASIERRIQTGLRSIARAMHREAFLRLRAGWAQRQVRAVEQDDAESWCSWSDSSGYDERERRVDDGRDGSESSTDIEERRRRARESDTGSEQG